MPRPPRFRSPVGLMAFIVAAAACAPAPAPEDASDLPDQGISRAAAEAVWSARLDPPSPPIVTWGCDPTFDRCWMITDRSGWASLDSTARWNLVAEIGSAAAVLHEALDTDFIDSAADEDLATYSASSRRVRLLQ